MVEVMERYLETERARERGMRSLSDIAVHAVRRYLESEGLYPQRPRFEVLNHYEDNVKLIDNEVNRITAVYFQKGRVWCELCDSFECIHIDYTLTLPEVVEALREKGWKLPPKHHIA